MKRLHYIRWYIDNLLKSEVDTGKLFLNGCTLIGVITLLIAVITHYFLQSSIGTIELAIGALLLLFTVIMRLAHFFDN
jgi:hypothetical protein